MNCLKKTFEHAGIYSIGTLLARAASFLMLPIYTRYLTPADFGTIELVEITVEVASIVAGAGVMTGMSKYYYSYQNEKDKKELISTIFIMILLLYLACSLLGIMVSDKLSLLVFDSIDNRFIFCLSFINLFFSMLMVVPFCYLRAKQSSIQFVAITIVKLSIQLILNIIFVVNMKMGLYGVLYSTLVTSLIGGAYLSFYTIKEVSFKFSYNKAKELAIFGYPFIATGLGAFVMTFSDRYFLNKYCDIASVGIYSLGYKFGFLLAAFPIYPLFQIWQVQRFEIVSQDNYVDYFNKFLSWFTIITITVALFIALTVSDVLMLMSNSTFWEAKNVVPIILIAYYFQACTDFFNFGIFYSGQSKYLAYGTVMSAFAIIAMSFLLIPKYGIYGAAWATLIAFMLRFVYIYQASQKLFFIKYNLTKPTIVIVLSCITYLLHYTYNRYFSQTNSFISLIIASIFFISYCYLLFATGIIEKYERKLLLKPVKYIYGLCQK